MTHSDGGAAGWSLDELHPQRTQRPWLVFLHGLLGSGADWSPVLPFFADWPWVTLNLPGHGRDARTLADGLDFASVSQGLDHKLTALNIHRYILVGYSLGGRIACYHACVTAQDLNPTTSPDGLRGLFVEGAHPGLSTQNERDQRLLNDSAWARRFRQQPMDQVLADWYRQPVFSDLTADARRRLIRLRAANNGASVAAMLAATSLARQPDLTARLRSLGLPCGYLCGERDEKFSALARQAQLPLVKVPAAGHNAHRASPLAFADLLRALLAPCY